MTDMLTAHYTNGTKTRPATLIIGRNARTDLDNRVSEHTVSGKAEARKIAAAAGAKCWNF